MNENSVLQPVGCEPTESFVLKPLIGLLQREPIAKRPLLWRDYWATGELCIFTGDTGSGKTLLALNLAKELATGGEGFNPNKVLYIGHEYDKQGFAERFGETNAEADTNFFFAVFNNGRSGVYNSYTVFKDWLVNGLVSLLDKTQATVLIFDQPDRLNLSNTQWIEFLQVAEVLRRERNLSVLLVVNTRTRNTARPVELYHTYKHQFTTPFADSVVSICRSHNYPQQRYIKHLKCKNRMWEIAGKVAVFDITENEETHALELVFDDNGFETAQLPRSKEKERRDKVMTAEAFRREGVSFRKIGELMDLPESTIRSWVGSIGDEKPRETPTRWYPGMTSKNTANYNPLDHPAAVAEMESRSYFDEEGNFVEGKKSASNPPHLTPSLSSVDEINPPHLSAAEAPLQGGDFTQTNDEQKHDGLLLPVREKAIENKSILIGKIKVQVVGGQ
jgi:DNA polymerase III delta prime subunit